MENQTDKPVENPEKNQAVKAPNKQELLTTLRATYRQPFDIEGPDCNYRVWIYALNSLEFTQWNNSLERNANGEIEDPYANAKFMQRCIRDESGKPYFTLDDITLLVETNCHIALPLINKCNEVNGIGTAAREAIVKN